MKMYSLPTLTLLTALLSSLSLSAQSDWAPIGTEWYFSLFGSYGGSGYLKMTSVGDTIINDTVAIILETRTEGVLYTDYVDSLEFFAKRGDSLFRYYPSRGGFGLVADFGAKKGDTLEYVVYDFFVDPPGIVHFEFSVDSSYQIDISGQTKRAHQGRVIGMAMGANTNPPGYDGTFIEDVGNIDAFFPQTGRNHWYSYSGRFSAVLQSAAIRCLSI